MRLIPLVPVRLLLSSTVLLATASALAQTPAPTTPVPAATPAPAPAPAAPAAATPPLSAQPAPTEAPLPPPSDVTPPPEPVPAAAPAEEEETFPAAWFRADSDLAGLQLWAGATHMFSDTIGLATDIYLNAFTGTPALYGEFDIGPSFVAGPVYITPMIGLQADWAERRLAALVPQLYVTGGPDPIYLELWLQNYAYTVFDKTGVTTAGGGNYIYGRFFIDYKFGKYFGVGPEIEFTLALNSKSKNAAGDSLTSLPIGLNFMLSNYGKSNNLFIFAGYETADTPNDKHLAGRLTFVHNF